MNQFGGSWTEIKISILETYVKQFLTVFKNKLNQKLIYFDGFAGSGDIEVGNANEDTSHIIEGAAMRILKIDHVPSKLGTCAPSICYHLRKQVPVSLIQTLLITKKINCSY